jgi:AcrR family transcriptional regulator
MQVTLAILMLKRRRTLASRSTSERIYDAAITLFRELGYRAATTKMIAERAGVNEVTVFRHFGSKDTIVQEYVERHIPTLKYVTDMVGKNATWNLESDLRAFAKADYVILTENMDMILTLLNERDLDKDVPRMISVIPNTLKSALAAYFSEMQRLGRMKATDPEQAAITFALPILGFVLMKHMFGDFVSSLAPEDHIENVIKSFVPNFSQ